MNIVLFTDTYPPEINGVATSCQNLRNILIKKGHNVLVVTTNPINNDLTYEDGIIRIPGLNLKKLYGYRAAWVFNRKAAKYIKDFRPDVIHIHTDFGIGQFGRLMFKRLRLPGVYTYHTMYEDYTYYFTKGRFDQLVKGVLRNYTKGIIEGCHEVIIPSIKTKDYFREIKIDKSINIVPTGIDFDIFERKNFKQEDIDNEKARLGIMPLDKVLLSLGRVAKEKSIDVCIKGFANYLKEYKDEHIKFVIVGGGPALDELIKLTKDLGIDDKVIFVGAVKPDQVAFYYQLGDYFTSASISETQGLTFMESMAASLPVLARFDTNLIGVIEDNKTGFFYIDENNFVEVLHKVIHMKKEEKDLVIANAKEKLEPFSIDKFASNVVEVYKRAIKKNW